MIGIDTNIIVRALLRDDEAMYQRVVALLSRVIPGDPLIVNSVVVAETLWVLERRAKIDRRRARRGLLDFLHSEQIAVSSANPLRKWAETLESRHRDYSDVIIAQINLEIGCSHTLTLDAKAAANIPGMELLA